ncbi:protein adenylyltransferase SelO [Vibrio gallicus]|uniref:protein adenylyltransferase SelO n=1 Tax=Vibrio gallicus TaxID=190897 RepID=UPI0021C375C5|nr:YdiU family protein [Vibrio gallicus]
MQSIEQLNYISTYYELGRAFGSQVNPTPLQSPYLIHANHGLAKRLGISLDNPQPLIELFSGQQQLPKWHPLAMKYTGHQFGHYNPDLGDGRGLLLSEFIDRNNNKWDMHLKGSGKTPYSRSGDGRAVIRSSVREYLVSAAMQGLGIETTQALALIGSKTEVEREDIEYAATLLRIAPTHIRFGHFEYLFYSGQSHLISGLVEHLLRWHLPHLSERQNKYELFYKAVISNTATMLAKWQAYGFYHGVMNTDNMSILGQTLDYGPFAFMETYDPGFSANHSDYEGRYVFHRQPAVAHWNLSALGYALSSLIDKEIIESALQDYPQQLQLHYTQLMCQRFGLTTTQTSDSDMLNRCLTLMQSHKLDYHYTLRRLSELDYAQWYAQSDWQHPNWITWLKQYQHRLEQDHLSDSERQQTMCAVNPRYLLRTHLAQQAIDEVEAGNFGIIEQWLQVLSDPFVEHPCHSDWALPNHNNNQGIILSCSS